MSEKENREELLPPNPLGSIPLIQKIKKAGQL
jgi:hypothetical protein